MSTDRLTSRTGSSAISATHPSRADKEGYPPRHRSQAKTSPMLYECKPRALTAGRRARNCDTIATIMDPSPAPSAHSRMGTLLVGVLIAGLLAAAYWTTLG